jgi:hypothetical protein
MIAPFGGSHRPPAGKIMTSFTLHTIETAPDDSRTQLAVIEKNWKFVPNLHRTLPCDWVTHRRGDQRGRTLIDRGVSWWMVVRMNSRIMDRHVAVHSQGAERRWDPDPSDFAASTTFVENQVLCIASSADLPSLN